MYYTWISKKQIGVIFSNWKRGNINLTDEQIKWLYNSCCEVRGYRNDENREDVLARVKSGIDKIFANDMSGAEEEINSAYILFNACFA